MNKFVEVMSNAKAFEIENDWLHHCRKHEIPFVVIKSNRKTSMVTWDGISYPPAMDRTLFSAVAAVRSEIEEIYAPYITKDTRIGIGTGVISFWGLRHHEALDAAERLYDVIDMAIKKVSQNETLQNHAT